MVVRALLVAALAGLGAAREPAAQELWPVALEWRVEPLRPYPGQPVDVLLQVELPAEFADGQLIPRFRQPLDLHLELSTPFAGEAWGASAWELEAAGEGPRLALDGERVRLQSRRMGANRVLEHRTRWSFDTVGPRLLEPAVATGRWATSWRTDFLGQRTPNDTLEGHLASRAFSFDVRAFPSEGRPPSFVDAVGAFESSASTGATELEVGEVLTLSWTLTGVGNLERLTPPDFARFEDFHLLGIREEFGNGARTLHADLRALDPRTRALPPIAFASFDPIAERYVDLTTTPLPLSVTGDRALPKPNRVAAEPEVAVESIAIGTFARTLAISLILAGGLLLLARWLLRHPRVRHARALARFESALARGEEPRRALARFAVERLDLGPFAPFDPRFEHRLIERGAGTETARRWSAWVRTELAADYGGPRETLDVPGELARRLHDELRAAGRA